MPRLTATYGPRAIRQLPIAQQGVRFAIAGSIVMVVYLGTTSLLSSGFGLTFEAALPIGYFVSLCVHYTLQRFFVWKSASAYALEFRSQVARYLCVAFVQYGITAASTSLLPGVLGLPREAVYFLTVCTLTVTTFLLFRSSVFHAHHANVVRATTVGN